jgi:choline dehydrogenase-like flavoprotein
MGNRHYDAIVVGAGAGGGIAACVLATAGKSVLLLEKGDIIRFATEPRDHLRNHRLSTYGHNTGPDLEGNPRVFVDPEGSERIVRPHEGGYSAIASGVGSGTAVYGGMAWRFHPLDFKMASTYGVPVGSSLADWPIGYEDLESFYEQAEWEIGVSGGPPARQMPARRDYPMPPMPSTAKGSKLFGAADRLGWSTQAVPILANSVPRDDRPACSHCQHCVGFACPVDAKNGTQNTVIRRAVASGNCTLETGATATRVLTEASGRVSRVSFIDVHGQPSLVTADVVVLACGAVETARLLLLSRTSTHSKGIGNAHDQVGRHLQGHVYTGATGLMQDQVYDGIGPGPTVATLEFNHGNPGIVGGGMLCDEFVAMPLSFLLNDRPGWVPSWGKAHKDWMRHAYRHALQVRGPVHEIPSAASRVTLDPSTTDRLGLPVARLSGTTHRETIRIAEFMRRKAEQWLNEAGSLETWSFAPGLGMSAGQHQAGTCRMGTDPQSSVVDPNCRVHGHDNLFIADGSVHVTNGGFNPVLTIMALAYRTSKGILQRW